MLFEALYVPEGREPFPRSVLEQPEVAHYVEGFGRPGDIGVIALIESGAIGAAWARLLIGADAGYGYVSDDTPELTIAVASEWRGRGIGAQLMEELIQSVAGSYPAISLSCDAANPAMRLYERFGFEPVSRADDSITMLKRL